LNVLIFFRLEFHKISFNLLIDFENRKMAIKMNNKYLPIFMLILILFTINNFEVVDCCGLAGVSTKTKDTIRKKFCKLVNGCLQCFGSNGAVDKPHGN